MNLNPIVLKPLVTAHKGPRPLYHLLLHMPELQKLIFWIWNRRPCSAQPLNGFLVHFSSLLPDSDQKMVLTSFKAFFSKIPRGKWVS